MNLTESIQQAAWWASKYKKNRLLLTKLKRTKCQIQKAIEQFVDAPYQLVLHIRKFRIKET